MMQPPPCRRRLPPPGPTTLPATAGEGRAKMFRGHGPPPGGCAAADPVRQAGSAVRTCRAARRNRPPALAARGRHRLPAGAERNQSDGRQWLLMSAVPGDTLSALAQRGELEPSAWCAWWPPPCAGCTISIRLPVPSTIAWNGAWTPCASGSRPGWWTRRTSTTTIAVAAPRSCTACCSTGVRRSKNWWSPMATPACQICWRRAALQRLHRLRPARRRRPAPGPGLGRAGHRGRTRRGLGRGLPRRIRRRYRRRTAGVLQAIGRVLLSRAGSDPVRIRPVFARKRGTTAPAIASFLDGSVESPVQFSRYCASSFAESTRIRLGSVLCMAVPRCWGYPFRGSRRRSRSACRWPSASAASRRGRSRDGAGRRSRVRSCACRPPAGTQVPWQTLLDGTSASKPDSRSRRPMRIASGTLPPMLFSRSSLRE